MIINVLGIFVWIDSDKEYSVFSNRRDGAPWKVRANYSVFGVNTLLILD